MKALSEVGWREVFRFIIGTFFLILFRMAIFPPLRTWLLRVAGAKVGRHVVIHEVRFFNLYRAGFKALRIGNCCFIGDESLIDLAAPVELADHVTLAERVTILTHSNVGYKDHPLQPYFPASEAGVSLQYGCFVGVNTTILPGITVGQCAVVGAGSVVTKNVEAHTMVAGVPAVKIRTLDRKKRQPNSADG